MKKRLKKLKKREREKEKDELKKAWKERLLKESSIAEKNYCEMAIKKIIELESAITKRGLDTPTLKRLFDHTKKRFSLLNISKEDLLGLIKDILNHMGDIASINEISLELIRRGYELNKFMLEKILLELSMKGIIIVNRGVISSKRPSDTKLAVKLLEFIKKRNKVKINEVVTFLKRDLSVIDLIINDLNASGLITIDRNNNEIICICV